MVARWCQIWQKLPKITVFQKVCQLFWQYFVCQIFAIFKIPTACIGKTIHFGLLIKLISKLNREYNSTQWWDSKFFKNRFSHSRTHQQVLSLSQPPEANPASNRFSGLKKFQEQVLANRSNPITDSRLIVVNLSLVHQITCRKSYHEFCLAKKLLLSSH